MRFKAKPLRSVMFVPGNREDWMRKAHQYGPDALILDLEDSVPEAEKERARSLVASHGRGTGVGRPDPFRPRQPPGNRADGV